MYRGLGTDVYKRGGQLGRSPPRRRRTPEDENKFCIYCKVQLSSARLFDEHKNSAVHKQKEILIGKALSDGLQYCYTCEKIFPSKLALDAHCLMTRHKPLYRVDELQELISKKANPNIVVPVSRPPESRRAREEKERQVIVSKLNEVRGSEEPGDNVVVRVVETPDETKDEGGGGGVTRGGEFFCEVCNVDCMNYSNFKIHSESWRHRSEVDKKKEEEKKRFDKEAEKQFDAAEEMERKKVPEHLISKAGYFCEVCSIASVSESAYLEHLRNRKHFRQVGQMRRPYKCYICDVDFNVAKDFNYHLESRPHMDKAFKIDGKGKKREKDEEWVEKKTERREHRDKEANRDSRKDDHSRKDERGRSRTWHGDKEDHRERRSKEAKKDSRKTEIKESVTKHTDGRKVEIVDIDAPADAGIKDLREKLTAQKNIIITTKPDSPEREEEKPEVVQPPEIQSNRSKLEEVEKEFETKFEALMKQFESDHAGLQEQLARDREEDINAYQKYENDFKELKEEEEFVRGNIDKLDEDDPCKQDYIIDIIRVQRKMEEVRLQLEMKEVTIIKRENSYRKYFPETEEKQEAGGGSDPNAPGYVYDYNHGVQEKKEASVAQSDVESMLNPEKTSPTELSGSDLRIKLERERLLKRLGPELDAVDPALREKLLSVIFEKDKDGENLKPNNDAKSGDTRQVVKDDEVRMRELAKREKQLESELAKLKSADKKKKKNATKSLVPQYDDVDDKKKDTKKRSRKRSASSSSSSRTSSSSSDASHYKNKKKRKNSPPNKSRPKAKRSVSLDKSRRKRRSRSLSREREKRKRISAKKGKDDEKKKRGVDRTKSEKKKTDKSSIKTPEKGSKAPKSTKAPEDDDSDVQVITPLSHATSIVPVQPIAVLGASSVSPQMNATSKPVQTSTVSQQSRTSNAPPQRREQFSFWKNSTVQNPVVPQAEPATDSPKEDIWDTAFSSGGHKEDSAGSATLNLFDPKGGAQLPEDILNILKSVAPIIQQNNNHSPYKAPASRLPTATSPPANTYHSNSYNSSSSYNSSAGDPHENVQSTTSNNNNDKPADKSDSTRIRSILKKGSDHLPPPSVTEDPPRIEHLPEIPGLGSSADPAPAAPPRRIDAGRSILKPQSEFKEQHTSETSQGYYYDTARYSSNDDNSRREPNNERPPASDPYDMQPTGDVNDPNLKYDDPYDPNRGVDVKEQERSAYNSTDYRRPNAESRHDVYNNVDSYRPPPMERERVISPHLENRSPTVGPNGRPPDENLGMYDSGRNLRQERGDPYMRSEVTHRVIDYSYVRDTRVIPADVPPPSSRYNSDDSLKQPVRYPGETDDEYYARFERFYEMNRRKEEVRGHRDRDVPPPRRVVDSSRLNADNRVPPRDDYYMQKDRYDDRLTRQPAVDYNRPRTSADHDRVPPIAGRVIDESVRRIERIPYPEEGSGNQAPYQQVVEITKRVEDKSVRETGNADRPYRWPVPDSRLPGGLTGLPNDPVRNPRHTFPLRDFDTPRGLQSTLPRLPPVRLPPPRGAVSDMSRTRLPRPAPIAGDYDNRFQDY